MVVGWILISICCFYLIRNFYVGTFLYPLARRISKVFIRNNKNVEFRNYYLFVLNPFWWSFIDVFKDVNQRELMRGVWDTVINR